MNHLLRTLSDLTPERRRLPEAVFRVIGFRLLVVIERK